MRPESWLKLERQAMEPVYVRDPECGDCSDLDAMPMGECPKSKRTCGHHCNCVWVHDCCHWCGMEVDEDGNWPGDHQPPDVPNRVLVMALALAVALAIIVAVVVSAL